MPMQNGSWETAIEKRDPITRIWDRAPVASSGSFRGRFPLPLYLGRVLGKGKGPLKLTFYICILQTDICF